MRIALIVGALALIAMIFGAFFILSGEEQLDFDPHGKDMIDSDADESVRARRASNASGNGDEVETDEALETSVGGAVAEALAEHSVLVVNENNEPVAGASIEVIARDDDPFAFFRGDGSDRDQVVFTATTGVDGIAPVNVGDRDRVRIRARKARTYGSAEIDLDEIDAEAATLGVEAVVSLLPVRDLEVAIVGPGGAPIPHVLVSVSDPSRGAGRRGRGGDRGRRSPFGGGRQEWSADPTGLAKFEINADDDVYAAKSIEIRPQLPGFEVSPTTVDLMPQGITRALVSIPETIAVDLTLTAANAATFSDPVPVRWLVTALPDEDMEGIGRGWFTRSMFGTRQVAGGRSVIRGFAPGSTVTFRVTLEDRMPAEIEVSLPAAAATEFVELNIGADRPHVLARLVDPDGEAVRRERFTAEVAMAGSAREETPQFGRGGRGGADFARRMMRRMDRDPSERTDSDGLIRIPVEPGASGTIEIWAGRRMRMPWGGGDDAAPLATIEFPALEPGVEHEAGEVSLDRGPLLVAGRVVDRKGQPQEGVNVEVTAERARNDADPRSERRRRGGRNPFGGRGNDMRARSGGDGSFKIWAQPEAGSTYSVNARGRGVVAMPVVFAPGADDVEVVVESPGTIEGNLTFTDPRFAKIDAEVSMRASASDDDRAWRRFRVDAEQKFRSRGLASGLYDLRVRLGGRDALTRTGIEIVGGENRKPPELQNLLVGGGLQVAEVTVLDDRRRPVRGARVSIQTQGEEFDFRRMFGGTRTDEEGRIERVLQAGVTATLSVRADGFADVDMTTSSFPVVVVIVRGSSLRIDFGGGIPIVEGLRGYRLALRPTSQEEVVGTDPAAMFRRRMGDRGGRNLEVGASSVAMENISPGEYRVMIQLRPDTDGGGRRGFLGAFSAPELDLGTVTLEQGGGEQSAQFVVDAGAVEAALAAWEAQNAANTEGRDD